MSDIDNISKELLNVYQTFSKKSKLDGLHYEIRTHSNTSTLIIYLSNPTERFYKILQDSLEENKSQSIQATIKKKSFENLLKTPETQLLSRTLSESLNVNRNTFENDFFSRYIRSVFGAEAKIVASGNHIVFGRRGAGKSMLLLYALNERAMNKLPNIWIDMQTYSQRDDIQIITDVIIEILEQSKMFVASQRDVNELLKCIRDEKDISESRLRAFLPKIRRSLVQRIGINKDTYIFLDDFHILNPQYQAKLLDIIYAFSRGNNISIKLSAIENLVTTWNSPTREGLQPGHDLQEIRLDYNLTNPEKATEHITSILDAQAKYCALPSVNSLYNKKEVLSRLAWVSAGVPRDAISIFSQAMTKAILAKRKHVALEDINTAASEAINGKMEDLNSDAYSISTELNELLDTIKTFCIKDNKLNAFLVKILPDNANYQKIRKLIDSRILHVIKESLTVRNAGEHFTALILDYGFYIGIRTAKSVDLFNRNTTKIEYPKLRKLPIFGI